jgi:multiple sugar transport system substrate-binding protein
MRALSRRTLLGLGLGLAGSSFLAACAPPPAATEATAAAKTGGAAPAAATKPTEAAKPAADAAKPAAAPPPGAKEMTFHCRQGDLANHFVEYAKRWTEKNPDKPIKMETMVATNEYWVKLAALHASKTIGDNVVDISRFFPEMAYKGLYREMQPFIDGEKFDVGQYYPAAIENGKFDGKQYALPETYQFQSVMIYYNKDMFDAAGVKYPDATNATFDEIVEKAVKLTKPAENIFGYSGASGAHHIIVRSFGGDVLDGDRKKATLTSPEAVQATTWIQDLIYKHKVHPSPDQLQGGDTNLFAGGKVAMLQQTLWTGTFLIPLVAGKFKYGAALLPKGPTGVMGNHSQSDLVGVTANSKNPDIAWQIAKYMTAKDIGIEKVALNAGGPGARPDVQSDPGLQEKMIGLKEFQAALKENRKAFPEPKPWNTRSQELNDAFGQNTDPIWLNKATPADGLKKVNDEAQKVLDKPRP